MNTPKFHHKYYCKIKWRLFSPFFFTLYFVITSTFSQGLGGKGKNENNRDQSLHPTEESEGPGTVIRRTAKNTVTPVLLNHGDVLEFTMHNGEKRTLQLLETDASIMRTNVKDINKEQNDGGTIAQFTCKILIDGHEMTMQRYLPTQESFYEPYVINGMRIWFDAVQDYFDLFTLKHGWAKPRADARFAVSDAKDPVAPEMAMWYPNDSLFIDVETSYLGDDVWMGPYLGGSPHAGLDINTPKGTPLFSPVHFKEMDDQWLEVDFEPKPYYWAATMTGIKNWPNGSIWTLKTLHLDKYLVEEHAPLKKGAQFAEAAGTGVGANEHSHFEFMVQDGSTNTVDGAVMILGDILWEKDSTYLIKVNGANGHIPKSSALYIRRNDRPQNFSVFMLPQEDAIRNKFEYEIPQIPLDPWILFWQMFENEKLKKGVIHANIAPLEPVKTGEKVNFSSEESRSGSDTKDLTFYWTFGDGGFSNKENPEYIYAAPGIYPVSLVIDDGYNWDRFTQHITVDGEKLGVPALSLYGSAEPSFHRRKPYVMDTYGNKIADIPHTLPFVARQTNPQPEAKEITLINNGGGKLDEPIFDISYIKGNDWAQIDHINQGNDQKISVSIDATGLPPGNYSAIVEVKSSKALNSPQSFRILLKVKSESPHHTLTVDDRDPGFYATPYFWVGSEFHRWTAGYNDFYLTNGGRAMAGEYFSFTPDLKEGKYKVSFASETPFRKCRFKVLVHHAQGDTTVWMEPHHSRTIGEFNFSEGTDGYLQVLAEGSEGEIIADAVLFERVGE